MIRPVSLHLTPAQFHRGSSRKFSVVFDTNAVDMRAYYRFRRRQGAEPQLARLMVAGQFGLDWQVS